MIIVDDDGDIGVDVGQPFLDGFVSVEKTLPVRGLLEIVGHGIADGRNV